MNNSIVFMSMFAVLTAHSMLPYEATSNTSHVSSPGFREAPAPDVRNIFYNLPTLETERLILRTVQPEDADDLFMILSDPEVTQFTPVPVSQALEDEQARIGRWLKRQEQGAPTSWVIVLKQENKVIGICGFFSWWPQYASAEIESFIAKKYWGQGLMTAAKCAVIAYSFNEMGLNRIHSSAYSGNHASCRVNQKLGFNVIGIIPEYLYYKGAYWDRVIMSLLKKDFMYPPSQCYKILQ